MDKEKVVNITSRQERWSTSFSQGPLQISVSNHGRTHIMLNGQEYWLDMVSSVSLMSQVSESFQDLTGI